MTTIVLPALSGALNNVLDENWRRHLVIDLDDLVLTPTLQEDDSRYIDEIRRDTQRMAFRHPALDAVLNTYCMHMPCDGYIQGMNFIANVMLHRLGPQGAFWGLAKYMGTYRHYMPGIDKEGFINYAKIWNAYFLKFSDGKRKADEHYIMALKWGVYLLSCNGSHHTTSIADVHVLWDAMIVLPMRRWPEYTAAVAAVAVHRAMRSNRDEYDPRIMVSQLTFSNPKQLVRRALRILNYASLE